jgi:hypothetical protein
MELNSVKYIERSKSEKDSTMKDAEEYSESGVPIYHHAAQKVAAVEPDEEARQLLAAHIERWVGMNRRVWWEIIPGVLHVNIHVVAPTPERNYYTLITEGMSDAPMGAPAGMEAWRYTELGEYIIDCVNGKSNGSTLY